MTSDLFSPISLASATLGLTSVGILYALHHLKQQKRRRAVVTLLFWSHAVRPRRKRVLMARRFMHRKTFMLLAAILLLLAASITADRWGTAGERPVDVLVVDAGLETAAMDTSGQTHLGRMAQAAAKDFARSSARTAVISAGPRPVLLGRETESAAVAERRLAAILPQDGASASSLGLLLADGVLGDRNGRIHWYTLRGDIPADLPARVRQRIVVHASRPLDQAAVAGVTFESTPDDAGRGRLRVRVIATTAEAMPSTLSVRLQQSTARTFSIGGGGGEATVTIDDIAANGCSVTLDLPDAAAGRGVTLDLPDRRPLSYRVGGNVPSALKSAFSAVGTEAPATMMNVDIFVATQDTPVPAAAKAAILVVDAGVGIPSGVPLELTTLPVTRGLFLEHATSAGGPALTDRGTPLVMAGRAVAATMDRSSARPTLLLSRALVSPDADFPKHAAFPLLLGRLCDALIGRAAATAMVSQSRAAIDPLWEGPSDAPPMNATPMMDRPDYTNATFAESSVRHNSWAISWTNVVLLAAMALLVIEALLRAARKIV